MTNPSLRAPLPRRVPGGGRHLTVPLAVLFLGMLGCATPQKDKVMASVNAFHFYNARYEERCVPTGPKGCAATNAALKAWSKGLDEARDGLARGGAIPLNVAHVQRLQKETKKCLPK